MITPYPTITLTPKYHQKTLDHCKITFLPKGLLIKPLIDNAGNEFMLSWICIMENIPKRK